MKGIFSIICVLFLFNSAQRKSESDIKIDSIKGVNVGFQDTVVAKNRIVQDSIEKPFILDLKRIESNSVTVSLKESELLKEEKSLSTKMKEKELKQKIYDEKQAKISADNLAKRKKKLTEKYGESIAQKIVSESIWIGMTSEMAIESWGRPKDINRTVTQYGTSEQWIYSSKNYLYFENGKLTAWQD